MPAQINNISKCDKFISCLKRQFVPNYQFLANEVKITIDFILQTLYQNPSRQIIQQFSRKKLLQQAPLLRCHLWKLILKTLPLDHHKWNQTKQMNKQLYDSLIKMFIGEQFILQQIAQNNTSQQNYQKSQNDQKNIQFQQIKSQFDQKLWQQVALDTKRTHFLLNFFQKQAIHTRIFKQKITKNYDVMNRILYIWGKMNPNVRYVQGMNEILAPIYYLQYQDQSNQYNQSQVFVLFSSLMCFVLQMHIRQMDQCYEGIMGKIHLLNDFLKVFDYKIWEKLHNEGIQPHYYSFRWLSLMMAQQFGLSDTITLWDVLLSYDGYKRYFFLECCCLAVLKFYKNCILEGDIGTILPLIQKLKNTDVNQIIFLAEKIYQKYKKCDIEKQSKLIDQKRNQLLLLQKKQKYKKNQKTKIKQKFKQKQKKIIIENNQNNDQKIVDSAKSKQRKLFKNTSNFLLRLVPSALSPRINLNQT